MFRSATDAGVASAAAGGLVWGGVDSDLELAGGELEPPHESPEAPTDRVVTSSTKRRTARFMCECFRHHFASTSWRMR